MKSEKSRTVIEDEVNIKQEGQVLEGGEKGLLKKSMKHRN